MVAEIGINKIQSYKNDFADYYRDLINQKYSTLNDLQHAEIVRNYTTDIASSLKEYGSKKGYNLSNQFYNDMAWGGLTHWTKKDSNGNIIKDSLGKPITEETKWFKSAFPNSSDRKRVHNTSVIELTKKDTDGITKSQKGRNAGC
jgi:hypothetical protein